MQLDFTMTLDRSYDDLPMLDSHIIQLQTYRPHDEQSRFAIANRDLLVFKEFYDAHGYGYPAENLGFRRCAKDVESLLEARGPDDEGTVDAAISRNLSYLINYQERLINERRAELLNEIDRTTQQMNALRFRDSHQAVANLQQRISRYRHELDNDIRGMQAHVRAHLDQTLRLMGPVWTPPPADD